MLRTAHRATKIGFSMEYVYRVEPTTSGALEVRAASYRYRLLDANEREILAYHWHPIGVSPITYPHLHLSGRLAPLDLGPREDPVRLGGMHLPTGGPVTLADVVRLLITEFGVIPRRADWEQILAEVAR